MRISRRRFKPKQPVVIIPVNDKIRDPELRVITDDGEHLGVMPTPKALEIARERDEDLVVIQPKSEPPVAKIVDFGKYKYEKDMEKKQQKSKQKTVEVKGVRLSVRIGDHDKKVRKQKAMEFLEDGNKVKIEIILRGRERRYGDIAKRVIEGFIAELNADLPIRVDTPVTRQGGQLTAIVAKS